MKVSCVIVAGGKSKRMGKDKKLLMIGDKGMLEHVIEACCELSDDVIISLASKAQANEVKKITELKVVIDDLKGVGPLAGLMTGLKNCRNKYAAVLPCDTPFVEPKVFKHMIEGCEGYDGVIPKNDMMEPLHAVYKVQSMLKACAETMKDKKKSIGNAVSRLEKVNYIPLEVFRKYDKRLLTFQNINTAEELGYALKKRLTYGRTN